MNLCMNGLEGGACLRPIMLQRMHPMLLRVCSTLPLHCYDICALMLFLLIWYDVFATVRKTEMLCVYMWEYFSNMVHNYALAYGIFGVWPYYAIFAPRKKDVSAIVWKAQMIKQHFCEKSRRDTGSHKAHYYSVLMLSNFNLMVQSLHISNLPISKLPPDGPGEVL